MLKCYRKHRDRKEKCKGKKRSLNRCKDYYAKLEEQLKEEPLKEESMV